MATTRKALRFGGWLPVLVIGFTAGCGKGSQNSAPSLTYKLERAATSTFKNALLLDASSGAGYQFSISGHDFSSDVSFDEVHPIVSRVALSFLHYGDFSLDLRIFQNDGTPVIHDQLTWEADYEVPPTPIVSFSEPATNDANVALLVATNRGPGTNELWVAGDLADDFHPEGSWYPIPESSRIPIKVSDADGVKALTVKYRNKYGVEGAESAIQISRKSTMPTGCDAQVIATATNDGNIRFKLTGTDTDAVYYRISGDIDAVETTAKFSGSTIVTVPLAKPSGEDKNLVVTIHDLAENYCLRKDFTVKWDPDYEPVSVGIKGGALWTDNASVTLVANYEHFSDEQVEMYIGDGVTAGASGSPAINTWIPYATEVPITLSPVDGNRIVTVQFRTASETSVRYTTSIYLKPFLKKAGSGSPYNLVLSNIPGMKSVTIGGCAETYEAIQYQSTLSCTPSGSSVSASYAMPDGTHIVRSVAIP